MPLYEYLCEQCEDISETIQKFSDPPLTTCEACGGKLERLLSPSAIQFKGSGWYVNDYGKKDGKKNGQEAGAKNSSEKTEKKEAAGSSDSKSASKAKKDAPAK